MTTDEAIETLKFRSDGEPFTAKWATWVLKTSRQRVDNMLREQARLGVFEVSQIKTETDAGTNLYTWRVSE